MYRPGAVRRLLHRFLESIFGRARQKVAPETRRSTERFSGRKPRSRPFLDQLVPARRAGPVKSVLAGRFRAEFSPGMGQCDDVGTGLREAPGVAEKQPDNYMRPPRAGPKGTWAGCEEFGYLRVLCWANPRCKNGLKNSISGTGAFVGVRTWCYQRAV